MRFFLFLFLPEMSRDVAVLSHQILLLQPTLVGQVQTVTSQGNFLFGKIVSVGVTLSTVNVPEGSRISTTFGKLSIRSPLIREGLEREF